MLWLNSYTHRYHEWKKQVSQHVNINNSASAVPDAHSPPSTSTNEQTLYTDNSTSTKVSGPPKRVFVNVQSSDNLHYYWTQARRTFLPGEITEGQYSNPVYYAHLRLLNIENALFEPLLPASEHTKRAHNVDEAGQIHGPYPAPKMFKHLKIEIEARLQDSADRFMKDMSCNCG